MSGFRLQICFLVFLLSSGLATVQAQAPQYTVVDLGAFFYPRAINDSGQVVGFMDFQGGVLYADGVFKVIRPPGASTADAKGINNRGDVVGSAYFCDLINNQCQNGRTRAFIYSGNAYNILGTLGGRDSFANAINDFGQVTGYSYTSLLSSDAHAFVFKDGTLTDIGAGSGAAGTYAQSINANGQVVGFASSNTPNRGAFLYDNGSFMFFERNGSASDINNHGDVGGGIGGNDDGTGRAFLFSGGVEQDLGTLNESIYANAFGINNHGQVVGSSGVAPYWGGNQKAFIYSAGVMQDLNTLVNGAPGWVLKWAVDINDAGQIAATGTINGENHGFLLTPTKPMVLTQPNTNKAIAVQSVMFLHDPFTTTTTHNLSTDTRTRITLLVRNMETLAGESVLPPTMQAEDTQGGVVSLPVEFVTKVPGAGWLTQITFSLPDAITGRGDVQLSASFRGQTSNKAVITVGP